MFTQVKINRISEYIINTFKGPVVTQPISKYVLLAQLFVSVVIWAKVNSTGGGKRETMCMGQLNRELPWKWSYVNKYGSSWR